ncbi:MAG: SurA N-terminal domain-containing protein [Candidatus Marithrix sp.]
MLQNIRDNSQGCLSWVIVGLISLTFAVWGVGEFGLSNNERIIAEVNGVEIPERDFIKQVNQQKNRLRSMFKNQDLDLSFMQDQIRKNTLRQMIDEELLLQSATGSGMRISNGLLAARIHSFEAFKRDGKFSQVIYEQLLQRQGLNPIAFEMDMRRSLLAEQIRQGVTRSALVTDNEQRAILENQQRSVSYLIIPNSRFNNTVAVSDEEIATYYQENSVQYMVPELVSIEYIELSNKDIDLKEGLDEESLKQHYEDRKETFTTPAKWQASHILIKIAKDATLTDTEIVADKARNILAQVKTGGKSFAELVKQFSDDIGSKDKDGDLGWLGSGDMLKPFEDAVKTMQIGEISELVKSRFGFHIIKLNDTKPEVVQAFADVRTQIKQDLFKELAESKFYTLADNFGNVAFENPNSLEAIIETMGLISKTTELFSKNDKHPEDSILSNSKVITAAFSDSVLKDSFNSEVIDIGEQRALVLRVKEHKLAKAKPLEEVKNSIKTALTKIKTEAEAKKLGENLLEQIKQNTAPNIVAQNNDLTWSTSQVTRQDRIMQQAILQQAFKMGYPTNNKAIYQSLELDNGDFVLIAVSAVKAGKKINGTTTQYKQSIGDSEFNQLVSGLKIDAEIKDNSVKLADDS